MPIKLANNASARLAAPLANTDTTAVLVMDDIQNFPALAEGEWHPLTVFAPSGVFEIMRVTARSQNMLTLVRAQEGTIALNFDVQARAEIRITAAAIEQLRADITTTAQNTASTLAQTAATNAQNAAKGYTDGMAATIRSEISTAIASERGTSASEVSTLNTAIGTKFDKAGGTVTGDVTVYRPASPGTGVVFLGNSGSKYLFYDGTNYIMPGGGLYVNGSPVWTSGNFNPGAYMPTTGGTFTGNLTIQNGAGYITFYDVDWGYRHIHCNDGNIGFLNNGGGWACYSSNDGTFVATGNIGAYSDRKHKTDIETIGGALALVEKLRGVFYTDRRTGGRRVGVIAQEVQEHLPEVVGEGPDGLHVDYGNIVGPLIEAVKELWTEVRLLKRGL